MNLGGTRIVTFKQNEPEPIGLITAFTAVYFVVFRERNTSVEDLGFNKHCHKMSAIDIEYQIAHNYKILTNILGNSAFLVPIKTYSPGTKLEGFNFPRD